jgi:ABC-type uncharacterized transport system involved in gliding motility auxiliary subunit
MSEVAERRIAFGLTPRVYAAALIALAVILFLAVNILANSSLRGARIDLTEGRLFTLSAGTLNILRGIEEPVTLRFYYSEKLATDYPAVAEHARRVRDMLEEYAARADGNIILRVIDPEPFSIAEDEAMAQGLHGARTSGGERLYFGLVGTNTVDGREVIPFFAQDRLAFLEYDLTELVHRLTRFDRPELGIVTNLPLDTGFGGLELAMQGLSRPMMLYQELAQRFAINFLEQEFDIVPDSVDVLMIAHPRELSAPTLYAIDQFVMRGGRVLAFVDPYSELSLTPGPTGQPVRGATVTSDLSPLFASWGVEFDATKIVGDRSNAQTVATTRDATRPQSSYILWHAIRRDSLNTEDPVTAEIKQINLASVGHLRPRDDATTEFMPLIRSSADAALYNAEQASQFNDPDELLRHFSPDGERYVLAARLTGPVRSAFPDGPPAADEEADEADGEEAAGTRPHHAVSDGPANIIILADSDIFDDHFWVVERNVMGERVALPTADNATFVINAIENLMGSDDLLSLRGRTPKDRSFTVVDRLRRQAEQRFLAEEQRLRERMRQAEERIAALEGRRRPDGLGGAALTPEQEAEIDRFRRDLVTTRAELREVQRRLRADIEALGDTLRFINIALTPLAVAGVAVGLAYARRRRRKLAMRKR